ncbi:hypothetical protein P5673_003234 [Acropora cervicornis]|uniref:Uncharacterized protein n=1 Tax=Acropora cervicornis TaxID=6130 RepID=A0AAD9R298_ACRCE|nr:hypothetical protein P5673_003234 [Acropora cervicornis]
MPNVVGFAGLSSEEPAIRPTHHQQSRDPKVESTNPPRSDTQVHIGQLVAENAFDEDNDWRYGHNDNGKVPQGVEDSSVTGALRHLTANKVNKP